MFTENLTRAQKDSILEEYLRTDRGCSKLAKSLNKPLQDMWVYKSIPAKVLYSSIETKPVYKFSIFKEVISNKYYLWERLQDLIIQDLRTNEDAIFWNLCNQYIQKKIIKQENLQKKVSRSFLESMSQNYDYMICNAFTYASIRKLMTDEIHQSSIMQCGIFALINNMQLLITRAVPNNEIFFFKKNSGSASRNIKNVSIKIDEVRTPTEVVYGAQLEQQFNITINPEAVYAVRTT